MKFVLPWFLAVLFLTPLTAPSQSNSAGRPHILGVSHLCVYSSDPAAAERFYAGTLGATKGKDPESPSGARYYFSPTQFVEVMPLPANHGLSRLDHVAYITDNADGLHAYLAQRGQAHLGAVQGDKSGRWFTTRDPEGNMVQFVQSTSSPRLPHPDPISTRIIHVGYAVKDRSEEDRFYKTLLGFRPYWYGGMQPDKIDWISQQVPDGTDWLEYMMIGGASGRADASVSARELGVLNHVSLGVASMQSAVAKLTDSGRLTPGPNAPRHDQTSKVGKDGKWQFNLYDPDGTRIELMEFQPVQKPCCSAFTAASPTH